MNTQRRTATYGRAGNLGWLSDRARLRVEHAASALFVAVGALLLLGAGVGPVGRTIGAGLLAWAVLAAAARWSRPRGPVPRPVAGDLDGRAATLLRRDPRGPFLDLVATAVIGLTVLALAALTVWLGQGSRAAVSFAVLLLAFALLALAPVALVRLGRYDLGVTAFTPDHLEYRSFGLRSSVAWDDIAWAIDLPDQDVVHVTLFDDAPEPHRWTVPVVLRGEPKPVPRVVTVPVTRFAGETAPFTVAELARIIQHLHVRPELRAPLGTARGPEHLARLAITPV